MEGGDNMRRIVASVVFAVFCGTIISGCQTLPDLTRDVMKNVKGAFTGPTVTYESVDPDTLPPVSKLAISAFEMQKQGLLDSFPFASVDQTGVKLFNKTDYSTFTTRNIAIVDFQQNETGSFAQTMICESVDRHGRTDVSENRIVFSVRDPSEEELANMREAILASFRGLKGQSKEVRAEIKNVVAEYQRAKGLTADGIPGKNTVDALARDIPILHVSEISSTILYPQKPTAELYVLPFETVDRNVSLFNEAFSSLDTIRERALTPEALKELVTSSQKVVLFVYFLDRVNPELPVRLSLSPSEWQWSETHITPLRYAVRDTWPVMIETVTIDESLADKSIYANLFLKFKCIGSFKIY